MTATRGNDKHGTVHGPDTKAVEPQDLALFLCSKEMLGKLLSQSCWSSTAESILPYPVHSQGHGSDN